MKIRKTLKLNKSDYFRMHLEIITSMMPVNLTDRELDVLAEFMAFDGPFAKDRFGTSQRKIVMENLKMKAPNLSNILKDLNMKGVIQDGKILDIFLPDSKSQDYEFKLVRDA